MKIKSGQEAAWKDYEDRNQDSYGKGVIDYARRWADLMEVQMTNGEELGDIYKATSHEADTDGITGFMYGAAVSTLAECWEHGDALRILHNADYGVSEDKAKGGTVNPAILTIGSDSE